jgi:hypothetical protein
MKLFSTKEDLRSSKSILIEEEEVFSELAEKKGTSLFLGKYSMTEVLSVLGRRNFFNEAKKRGLWPLEFNLDSSEFPPVQRFQIFFKLKSPKNLIVDLKIKEGKFSLKDKLAFDLYLPEMNCLVIEWLTLQNPLLDFSKNRIPLPGQNRPGLNLGKKVLDIFIHLARANGNDGIIVFPAYFHNALLFSRSFCFVDPEKEGEVRSIKKLFPGISFKQLAWIIHLECLRTESGEVYKWNAKEQVFFLNKRMKNCFESKKYQKAVKKKEKSSSFTIDWDCYKAKNRQESVNSGE